MLFIVHLGLGHLVVLLGEALITQELWIDTLQ